MVQRVGQLLCPRPGIASKTYIAHKQNGLAFIQLNISGHLLSLVLFLFMLAYKYQIVVDTV